jgi:hypothetical protein
LEIEMALSSFLPIGGALLRSARRLARFATLMGWLIPPLVVAQYLFFDAPFLPTPNGMASLLVGMEWTLQRRLLAAAVGLLPALAVMLARRKCARGN